MVYQKNNSLSALHLDHGFPYDVMAFASGQVCCSMSEFGGVNSLQFLEVMEFEGKLYPDMFHYFLLSKERGNSHNRPVYGPAIRFKSCVGGTDYFHYPEKAKIYPFGYVSTQSKDNFRSGSDLLCGPGNSWSFRFKRPAGDAQFWSMNLSRSHLHNGQIRQRKNQCADTKSWLSEEFREPGFDKNKPFPDQLYAKLSWLDHQYIPEKNTFLLCGKTETQVRPHGVFLAFKFSEDIQFKEYPEFWYFACPWENCREIRVSIGLGFTREEALEQAENAVTNFDKNLKNSIARAECVCRKAPDYRIEGLDGVTEFMQVLPAYQNTNLVAVTGKEACIKAASFDHGYFVLWDHIFPIRDFLFSGDLETAEKLIRYLFDYPHFTTALWSNLQLIQAIDEYCACAGNDKLLIEAYPLFKQYLDFAKTLTDPETGFLAFMATMAADDPHEMGLDTPLFYASSFTSWYYGACRIVENLARKMNDEELCRSCFKITRKIEANFLKYFFDYAAGYPHAMLTMDKVPCGVPIHSNAITICLDYLYGRKLLDSIISRTARFQAQKLYHPWGHTAVESDSETLCEMWKNVHMNQHLGHEAKLARYANMTHEAYRIMREYLRFFLKTGRAVETFNLESCPGNTSLFQRWQSFSATGGAEAIRQGLCGMHFHRGGFTILPADDNHKIQVDNLHFAGSRYQVNICGSGRYIRSFKVNGKTLRGSMQLPVSYREKQLQITIQRGKTHPSYPVLLQAMDLPVDDVKTSCGMLSFTVKDTARTPVWISTQVPAEVRVNGKPVPAEYDPDSGILLLDVLLNKNDVLCVEQIGK